MIPLPSPLPRLLLSPFLLLFDRVIDLRLARIHIACFTARKAVKKHTGGTTRNCAVAGTPKRPWRWRRGENVPFCYSRACSFTLSRIGLLVLLGTLHMLVMVLVVCWGFEMETLPTWLQAGQGGGGSEPLAHC